MALNEIGPWLMENPAFVSQLEGLTASAVADDLGPSFTKHPAFVNIRPDWGYFLLCGSFLAISTSGPCQAAALRIAHSCLTDDESSIERKDSAALLLDTLANHPALELAISRELLKPALRDRLRLPARIEWTRRSIDDSVSVGDRSLRVNHFQKRFWKAAADHEWLSVSAPTSTGKSFIVSQWITTLLAVRPAGIVIYLVPTRALISQVERDMRAALSRDGVLNSDVISTPVRSYIKEGSRTVLVFTQERLHILMAADPHLKIDALVVDEAHKIGDRTRGVLLQQVIEGVISTNPGVRVIFASPMSSNPETLIADVGVGRKVGSLTSDDVMVSQNLIWVSQMPRDPMNWRAQLCLSAQLLDIGQFKLPASPLPPSKRLPFVAAAVGAKSYGNVVYVNGAADAEKAATQLYDLFEDIESQPELDDLITLCAEVVHPEFLLQKVLRRGIAFHYGNLPLILREAIERLFTSGVIRYLVCTSTLVEGVNMSCRNIFIRGPKRGKLQPMTQEDFWNLAGRAGRWGKEFQGNIVCVDASDSEVWGSGGAPRTKAKYQIHRATDTSMGDLDAFLGYVERNAPSETRTSPTRFEATFSYLCSLQERHGSIGAGPWAGRYSDDIISRIESAVTAARSRIQTPPLVVQRNPGISPFAMDLLLNEFRTRGGAIDELIPANPGSNDAVESYVSIFGRCARTIAPSIGPVPTRQFSLALLVTHWMRGYQLSRLIIERLNALRKKDPQVGVAKVIRSVMEDVEQIARFEAPRVMACYRDLLQVVLLEKGRQDLIAEYPDLSIYLEYGVAQDTQISLITSGLSRTSTIALSELIASNSLTKEGVQQWLLTNARLWQESSLSPLVKREIEAILPTA